MNFIVIFQSKLIECGGLIRNLWPMKKHLCCLIFVLNAPCNTDDWFEVNFWWQSYGFQCRIREKFIYLRRNWYNFNIIRMLKHSLQSYKCESITQCQCVYITPNIGVWPFLVHLFIEQVFQCFEFHLKRIKSD